MKGDKDNHLWLDLWNDKDSSFHQSVVNRFLVKLWPDLLPRQKHTVFVPFCGKSQDMFWLSNKGYQVLGVELSAVAVEAFFKENRLKATQKKLGSFVRWRSGNITVLCGDYFQLERRMLAKVSSIYDCAALAALADDVRPLYVAHMRHLIDANIEILLLSIEDDVRGPEDTPMPEVEAEVVALYGASCDVHLRWQEQMASDDPQRSSDVGTGSTYKVYRIEAHWGADDTLARHSLA
jgi:thiopurine S-methyltransferase